MGMFQVKQSNDEEFDIERFDDNSPPPQSNLSAAASGDKVNDADAGADDGEAAADGGGASFVSYIPCISVNKKTVIGVSTMLVIGVTVAAVVASMSNGAAGNSQIQKSFATAGKAPKSFCEPDQVITCGDTFTNEKVVLSDDLFCTDQVAGTDDSVLEKTNAAIKVEGPNAVLDCKGHAIIQRSTKPAAACEEKIDDKPKRVAMKKNCDLFYQFGIWLVDGATAINCKVENFYDGIRIADGGEVKGKKSEVSGNLYGVFVRDNVGATTKISDV